jgi:hypothetical protein
MKLSLRATDCIKTPRRELELFWWRFRTYFGLEAPCPDCGWEREEVIPADDGGFDIGPCQTCSPEAVWDD